MTFGPISCCRGRWCERGQVVESANLFVRYDADEEEVKGMGYVREVCGGEVCIPGPCRCRRRQPLVFLFDARFERVRSRKVMGEMAAEAPNRGRIHDDR